VFQNKDIAEIKKNKTLFVDNCNYPLIYQGVLNLINPSKTLVQGNALCLMWFCETQPCKGGRVDWVSMRISIKIFELTTINTISCF